MVRKIQAKLVNRPDDEVYALLFPGRGERGSV